MNQAIHFVGFKPKDLQRWQNAVAVFGEPHFVHPGWDLRAQREIADGDLVVFAKGEADQTPRQQSYADHIEPDDPAWQEVRAGARPF